MLPHESFKLLQREGYLFQSSLTQGLTSLRNANDSTLGNFYVAFFQLSIGLERLMKSAIVVHHMANNNLDMPPKGTLKPFGHGLLKLFEHIASLSISEANPLKRIEESSISFDILTVLDDFAGQTRYFNLDSLSAPPSVSASANDPLGEYEKVIARILEEDVGQKTVYIVAGNRSELATTVERCGAYASNLCKPDESTNDTLQRIFIKPPLQDLASKYAVYHVIIVINALSQFIGSVSCAAQDLADKTGKPGLAVPYMQEFLQFSGLDRRDILRKRRWP